MIEQAPLVFHRSCILSQSSVTEPADVGTSQTLDLFQKPAA